jgi:hypothetical protein
VTDKKRLAVIPGMYPKKQVVTKNALFFFAPLRYYIFQLIHDEKA